MAVRVRRPDGPKIAVFWPVGIQHLITIATIALTGLLPASCTKTATAPKPPPPAAPAASTAPKPSNSKDLGVVELTNHSETRIQLSKGKTCIITPNVLDHGNVQLVLTFESRSEEGRVQNLCVLQVTAQTDKPFDVAIGDTDFTLTPKLAAE